jgi:hypothetical protein
MRQIAQILIKRRANYRINRLIKIGKHDSTPIESTRSAYSTERYAHREQLVNRARTKYCRSPMTNGGSMKPISRYLDDAIDRGLSKNDSETARKIGVTRAAVSDWRVRKASTRRRSSGQACRALRIEAGEVLAECGAARAKTPETRRAWERIAARMAASSITACAMVIATGQSQEASASQSMPYQQSAPSNFQNIIIHLNFVPEPGLSHGDTTPSARDDGLVRNTLGTA